MKKRLLSLFLCVLTIVSSFMMASCSDDEGALARKAAGGRDYEFTTTSSNAPITICIYSIRGKNTTDEAIELVEKELSRIAVNRYNTYIDLILIDEEDYASMIFTKVKNAIATYNSSLIKDITTVSEDDLAEIRQSNVDYYYTDLGGNKQPYGVKEATNLPSEVLNGTLDIFLCYTPEGGNGALYESGVPFVKDGVEYGMFDILYNEKALAPLNSYLNTMYSDLKNIAYTHAMEYVTRPSDPAKPQSSKDVFAIPNNYTYGSYDYIVFNDKYVSEFTSPEGHGYNKQDYVDNKAMMSQLVQEVYAKYEGGAAQGNKIYTEIEFSSYEEYIEFTKGNYAGKKDGYINDFAIAKIKNGTLATEKLFKDENKHNNLDVYREAVHEVGNALDTDGNLIMNPELCESMFCIGLNNMGAEQDGARVKRSLDILKLINTNVEFRNILQYGVVGTHYTQYSEDEDVNPINSLARPETQYDQSDVAKYFGNMFLLYPSSTMSDEEKMMAADKWQLAKDQIFELVPYLRMEKK